MLEVTVESTELETRNKKGGGTYQTQRVYFQTFDRSGPKRYPEEGVVFPKRDSDGNAIPYQKGHYMIAPSSFRIERGFPELGFVELVQVKK